MARRKAPVRLFLTLPVYLVIGWAIGFMLFLLTIPTPAPDGEEPTADAIVVLTGGAGRLDAGISLLSRRKGERLLISGVHPTVAATELSALTGAEPDLFACCVDLDHTAHNTISNAEETALWARSHGYRRLLVVTADYHMPRSLMLLRRAMPEAEFIAHPVRRERPIPGLALEYTKYLAMLPVS